METVSLFISRLTTADILFILVDRSDSLEVTLSLQTDILVIHGIFDLLFQFSGVLSLLREVLF